MQFDFSKRFSPKKLKEFTEMLLEMQKGIDFKVSSRGWCYLMEQAGYINKGQFNKVDNAINTARKNGLLPVDFVAEEDARAFAGVEEPSSGTVKDTLAWMLRDVLDGAKYFIPDWWKDEEYYIQVVVEKIDLKTLFTPICANYHIPIANSKGWSSILQRAEYCRRFSEAEKQGLKCVLLYCGDHDPDGLRISDTLRKNLEQISKIHWGDGYEGYDPSNLIIHRFGLNYDFIEDNSYTWIDNLVTGSEKNLADPSHPNFNLPYVQDYLRDIGERKCEANVIVTTPDAAKKLMNGAIEHFLGTDSYSRFKQKRYEVDGNYQDLLDQYGVTKVVNLIQKDLNDN